MMYKIKQIFLNISIFLFFSTFSFGEYIVLNDNSLTTGILYLSRGMYEKAIKEFKAIVDAHSGQTIREKAITNLSIILMSKSHYKLGNYDEAEKLLKYCLTHSDDLSSFSIKGVPLEPVIMLMCLDGLSEIYIKKGRIEDSEKMMYHLKDYLESAELKISKLSKRCKEDENLLSWIKAKMPLLKWKIENPGKSEEEYPPTQ